MVGKIWKESVFPIQGKMKHLVLISRPRFPSDRGIKWISQQFPNLEVLRLRAVTATHWEQRAFLSPNRCAMEYYKYPSVSKIMALFPHLQRLELEVLTEQDYEDIDANKEYEVEEDASNDYGEEEPADEDLRDLYSMMSFMEVITVQDYDSRIQSFYAFLMGTISPSSWIRILPKDVLKHIYEIYKSMTQLEGWRSATEWKEDEYKCNEKAKIWVTEYHGKKVIVGFENQSMN